jgi:hypothetical protein
MGAIEVEGTERPRRDADNGFGVGTRVAPRENAAIENTVLITLDGSPQAVSLQLGWGRIVLIASDNVFSNASLAASDKENGALAVRLLEAAGVDQKVVFDESLNATGTPRVVGVLLDPTLRPMTLQLAVVLIAFGWRGSRRFGGVLPQSAPARHDVSLHTDALGNLYYKSRNGAVALRAYLEQLQTALHLRFAAGHERRAIAALAERVGQPVDEVQRLLKTARETARRASVPRHEAATLIRRLSELRKTTSPTR